MEKDWVGAAATSSAGHHSSPKERTPVSTLGESINDRTSAMVRMADMLMSLVVCRDGICEDLRCVCGLSEWFGRASSANKSSAAEGEANNATCCADRRDVWSGLSRDR
jgi:hypothetical protein